MPSKIKYFLSAVAAAVIWGFFSISLRHLKEYPPEQIVYYRVFTSLIIILVIISFRRNKIRADTSYYSSLDKSGKQKFIWLTLLAGFLITGNWFTFIYAVNNVSLKSAAFAYMVCPLITASGGFLLLKEALTRLKFIAIAIAVGSIVLLARGSLTEVLWSVLIATLYSFYLIIQRVIRDTDKLNMLALHLSIATVLLLPFYIAQFERLPTAMDFWASIVLIAVVFTIIPLFLSLYSLNGIPSSTLGIIIYVNPLVAFTVAFFYFQEEISLHQLLAYSLLLVAVVVFNWGIISRAFRGRMDAAGYVQPNLKNSD